MNDINDNVKQLALRCSNIVGEFENMCFYMNLCHVLVEHKQQSPIEQMFEASVRTLIKILGMEVNSFRRNTESGEIELSCPRINITPQYEIGKYRVDYFLSQSGYDAILKKDSGEKKLVVELDGHAFHDKDEKQRRYEKARDRYLQKQGLTVFRYTGSEIFKNPFNAAIECMLFFGVYMTEEQMRAVVEV